MRNRKFIIGFLIFDIVAVLIIVLVLVIANPFEANVAPVTTTAPGTTTQQQQTAFTGALSSGSDLDRAEMEVFFDMPALVGMREESEKTSDDKYYTAYRADLDLDLDGDGELESISVSLDDHSESFYVLVNDGGNVTDYVVPGHEFGYVEKYSSKACKGNLRGYLVDLDKNDIYTEVAIEMMRDTWDEYQTLVVRYDGSAIHASVQQGMISGVSNAGSVQFSICDAVYGVHKLFKTCTITSDTDFLKPRTTYFFTDISVEKTSYVYNPGFDLAGTNLNGEPVLITMGTSFYWVRTDNETFVDVLSTEGNLYRLPVTGEVMEYASGPQTVYRLGDHDAAEIKTR
ncbi:MAG: hypothetical protein J5379_08250 [Clostridiales bacterium]|nr:hypothetical protein [Clostridiales bacterium]